MGGGMSSVPMVRRYIPADAASWNDFVRLATNATFLHNRDFMEYHADRFDDHSLIIEDASKIIALLPASQAGDVLHSHGGLTYGGILVPPRLAATTMVGIVASLRNYLTDQDLRRLVYKPSPHIFHTQPSEADLYALINDGAQQIRADLGTAIPLKNRIPFNNLRNRGVKKATKAGLTVQESTSFALFWNILTDTLGSRHDATPTHSLDEITLLNHRFPDRIRLFGTFDGDTMLAGMTLFDCGCTVHAQYIAAAPEGRNSGALDLLVHHLLEKAFADRTWFSFGISTTDAGRELNVGLSRQKEMFGGHSVIFSQYQWDIT